MKYFGHLKTRWDRSTAVAIFLAVFAGAIFIRLFNLQVLRHDEFIAHAEAQQVTTNIDPASRGKIFIKANKTGEPTVLAENLTLYLLYVDPNPFNDKEFDDLVDRDFIAEKLSGMLYMHFCGEGTIQNDSQKTCQEQVEEFVGKENLVIPDTTKEVSSKKTTANDSVKTTTTSKTTDTKLISLASEDIQKMAIKKSILQKITEREVVFVPFKYTNNPEDLDKARIAFANLPGIYVGDGVIYGNPKEAIHVDSENLDQNYKVISDKLNMKWDDLNHMMTRRISRYSYLTRRVTPELRSLIEDLKNQEKKCPQLYTNPAKVEGLIDPATDICMHIRTTAKGRKVKNFFSVALRDENWRYYPEDSVASQVVGFLNFDREGNYGIEEEFDNLLRGKEGKMTLESDPMGNLIASNLKADQIQDKEDGVDVYLTIDRVVQKFTEDKLRQTVIDTRANSGVVVIMDPFTGDVVAMAQYPSFNPNFFQDVYEMKETFSDPGKGKPMFIKGKDGELINIPDHERNTISASAVKYVYKNQVGPGGFYNMIVQQPYEPGSIFKPLIMAAGIDSKEITPQTHYVDRGELKVDEFTIRNVSEHCLGTHDMINVLNYSCNIGMSFIAQKMGKALMYKYIKDFGFGERTDIELPNEAKGIVKPYEEWSAARQYNAAFGQGLTATPIQLAQAFSALANGGVLINPRLVDKIVYPTSGRVVTTEKKVQNRVISKETADTIAAMLTQVVEKGGSHVVKIDGYYIAGKTGTAQIASSQGGYENDPVGSTNGSFAGFFPSDDPKYVIITKIERPRSSKWADSTAAPLFKQLAEFMLSYYAIAPNRPMKGK